MEYVFTKSNGIFLTRTSFFEKETYWAYTDGLTAKWSVCEVNYTEFWVKIKMLSPGLTNSKLYEWPDSHLAD